MKASVIIEGLKIKAYHGVNPQEKKVGNIFEVTVSVDYPPALRAIKSDSIQDSISYVDIVNIINSEMARPSDLLENVAGRIHRSLVESYPAITGGWIKIAKIAPPISADLTSAAIKIRF